MTINNTKKNLQNTFPRLITAW